MLYKRIHNCNSSEVVQTVRAGVSSLFNCFQFTVAKFFWSIMRTWLRDMLIVLFFLGTALYLFIADIREYDVSSITLCSLHRMQRTRHCTSVNKLFFSLHRRGCYSELWIWYNRHNACSAVVQANQKFTSRIYISKTQFWKWK